MPNRDLDDDAVDPIADDEDEDVLGSAEDDDDMLDDDEDEEFDEEEDEETGLTSEVGSEGGSPGEAVQRVRSRASVGGSEVEGLARDQGRAFRSLRDEKGGPRKRTP